MRRDHRIQKVCRRRRETEWGEELVHRYVQIGYRLVAHWRCSRNAAGCVIQSEPCALQLGELRNRDGQRGTPLSAMAKRDAPRGGVGHRRDVVALDLAPHVVFDPLIDPLRAMLDRLVVTVEDGRKGPTPPPP